MALENSCVLSFVILIQSQAKQMPGVGSQRGLTML